MNIATRIEQTIQAIQGMADASFERLLMMGAPFLIGIGIGWCLRIMFMQAVKKGEA